MYMHLDEEGTCWEYCRGLFNPTRSREQDDREQIQTRFLSWLLEGIKNESKTDIS